MELRYFASFHPPATMIQFFSGGQLTVYPLIAETCFGGPIGPTKMKSRWLFLVWAKLWGAPTAIAAFMYLCPGIHLGVALLISSPNTHTPIIIIIIIIIIIHILY